MIEGVVLEFALLVGAGLIIQYVVTHYWNKRK